MNKGGNVSLMTGAITNPATKPARQSTVNADNPLAVMRWFFPRVTDLQEVELSPPRTIPLTETVEPMDSASFVLEEKTYTVAADGDTINLYYGAAELSGSTSQMSP